MLKIQEVSSKEQYDQLRNQENNNIDYLYILKYNGTFVLSDNGKEIPMTSAQNTENNEVSNQEINNAIEEILNSL